jgi:hypothetical protein
MKGMEGIRHVFRDEGDEGNLSFPFHPLHPEKVIA